MNIHILTKYRKITENKTDNNTHVRIDIYYDLGGYNVFTHKEKCRGYYIGVVPCERSSRDGITLESVAAFSGCVELLEQCNRKSKNAEQRALEKVPAYEKMMLDYIQNKNGYILEEVKQ